MELKAHKFAERLERGEKRRWSIGQVIATERNDSQLSEMGKR